MENSKLISFSVISKALLHYQLASNNAVEKFDGTIIPDSLYVTYCSNPSVNFQTFLFIPGILKFHALPWYGAFIIQCAGEMAELYKL